MACKPFADSGNGGRETHPHSPAVAPPLQARIDRRRPVHAVVNQDRRKTDQRGEKQPGSVPGAVHPIHVRPRIGEPVRKHQQAQAGQRRGRGKVAESFQKKYSEHAGDREAILPREQQRAALALRPGQEQKSRRSPSACRVRVQESRWTQITAEALPPDGADRIASINRNERKQEQPDICLADARDEFAPGEIGQMNLMTGLVGERDHARQNHQGNQYPTKSSTHSHARLTAAADGVSRKDALTRSNKFVSPLMSDECNVTNVLRPFGRTSF